jgi:hypothetical protein
MLTINEILAVKPQFILSYDKDDNLLHYTESAIIGVDSEHLGELTIQYYSMIDQACLSFTIECLVSVTDGIVVIEQMDTNPDFQGVYANNIKELMQMGDETVYIWSHDIDESLHNQLKELIENQPIYDAPNNFIIEVY